MSLARAEHPYLVAGSSDARMCERTDELEGLAGVGEPELRRAPFDDSHEGRAFPGNVEDLVIIWGDQSYLLTYESRQLAGSIRGNSRFVATREK